MILAELPNWQECRTALLECDNDAIYLYSHPHQENLGFRSLWVANTKKRWFGSDMKADMNKGVQPYMPKKFCNPSAFIEDYDNPQNWRLQWGLDQNSIAVYFKDELIAIMPEWSGLNGFQGYSLGVNEETPLAWPLLEDNIQIERFRNEKAFLESWSEDLWITHQEALLKAYDATISGESKYFAADGDKWPPLGIHACHSGDSAFVATVGMSQLPMPLFGMPYEDPKEFRRVELAIVSKAVPDSKALAQYLAAQASYPWIFGTHFDHGHTIPCNQLKEIGSEATFMAMVSEAIFLPKLTLPNFEGDSVRMLYMVPIHESEKQFAEDNSTQALIQKLESECEDPLDVLRPPIV